MTIAAGQTFGIIGPLAAFPLRLINRHAEGMGCRVHRGARRQTKSVAFGRKILEKESDERIAIRIEAARLPDRTLLSENGLLIALGLRDAAAEATLDRQSLLEQSGLREIDFDYLRLFDSFEGTDEMFTFRDVILARKFNGLIAGGAGWGDIVRSIYGTGPVASLTAKSLHADRRRRIYARHDDVLAELSGQLLLEMKDGTDFGIDDLFADAEEAEADEQFEIAAEIYARCLAIDASDAVAAFNRANCLRAIGRDEEAASDYMRALKRDPSFVEAWFNLADLTSEQGRQETARRHLRRALSIEPNYADAIFNLARLEFEADELDEARRLWAAYLDLDGSSEWAQTARKGIRFVDLHSERKSTG